MGQQTTLSDFYASRHDLPEPRSLGERADRILEMMANPSELGDMPSPAQEYEAHIRRLKQADPPARSLGDEMVMLAAGPVVGRALPIAVRVGVRGVTSIRALSTQAEQAINAIVQSFRNRLGRDPLRQELLQSLGLAPDVGVNRATGLGNTFKGRTPDQVDRMLQEKGFEMRGEDPAGGLGGYVNPRNNRSYHIDPEATAWRGRTEHPHVDVNGLRSYRGALPKKKYPLGDRLHD